MIEWSAYGRLFVALRIGKHAPKDSANRRAFAVAIPIAIISDVTVSRKPRSTEIPLDELAHQADLDRTYISSLERSVYNSPTMEVVDRLATLLEVDPAELLKKS